MSGVEEEDPLPKILEDEVLMSGMGEELADDPAGPDLLLTPDFLGPGGRSGPFLERLEDLEEILEHRPGLSLCDVGIGPDVCQPMADFRGHAGQNDDGNRPKLRVLLEVATDLGPAHFRHDQIEDDIIRHLSSSLI